MAAKIRKGDKVVVLTGRDKGRTGEVIASSGALAYPAVGGRIIHIERRIILNKV